jgi:hypothetical protein
VAHEGVLVSVLLTLHRTDTFPAQLCVERVIYDNHLWGRSIGYHGLDNVLRHQIAENVRLAVGVHATLLTWALCSCMACGHCSHCARAVGGRTM